ncbi:transketolase [Ramlibacter sp. XY19]|uniref:transketolase n=1 Tax=Ramlibacter paludis TaxID=2908000 RepID=UPI0023DAADC4|nr:transketolase [Ramlibacter paludis]MCG2593054.1 transketolase [Ramlibacter paludis]
MRKQLCDALVARSADPRMVFLTGDLGFMALEPLQAAMGQRFINAGVAEQNMVTVAAALARQGLDTWAYSIAPFVYARPFEQIRNDVAFHRLPVRLIGNGGGYGYGVMGATHHAIEDYGVLLTLPDMAVFAPVFDEDVPAVIERAGASPTACYVRLGRGEPPAGYAVPAYAPWRQLTEGDGPVLAAVGPLAGTYIQACADVPAGRRPRLWAVAELPVTANTVPAEFLTQLRSTQHLAVAEEHVAQGGFASQLLLHLARQGVATRRFTHLHAKAHHYERYGSQAWLRRQSGLDPASLLAALDVD